MTLYDASIDTIPLEIETLDDQFEVAVARHEFPFKDGALLENMGQKARTVNIRCYFWDDGSHLTYNHHVTLVNHLRDKGLFELVHPQYGVISGMVERVSVRADDRELTAEVDLTFVENLRDAVTGTRYEDVEAACDQAVIDLQDQQAEQFEVAARDVLGTEAAGIVAQELDPELGLLEQFNGISQQARAWVKQVEAQVTAFDALLADVAQPANSLISSITYAANLPGRVIGSLSRLVDRYVTLHATVENAPSRLMRSMQAAAEDLIGQLAADDTTATRIRAAFATQGGRAVAGYYAADEQQRQLLRRLEQQPSFDALGRYLDPAIPTPVYTVGELETSVSLVRDLLQAAIDGPGGRSLPALKSMARSLIEHVSSIKLEREKIVTVILDNPMPLHIVCLRYGLDYHYAERLAAINTIPQPNYTADSLQIYLGPAS